MKAFIIYLPSRNHSVEHSKIMLDQLKSYNLEAQLWKGVPGDIAVEKAKKQNRILYPYSIKNQDQSVENIKEYIIPEKYDEFLEKYFLKITKRMPIGEDKEKLSLPGVIGCFYSHYSLWRKCVELDEPIMIFEDDVKFFRGWHPIEWDDVLVLSLGKSSFLSEPWKTYLENPSGNSQPVSWKGFSMPGASGYAIKPRAAKTLVKFYSQYFYPADNAINQYLVKIQVHNHLMGRNTLPDEGNISMTRAKDWT